MATVRKLIEIDAAPEAVWDAVRDVGALHTRLVRGFVVDTVLGDGVRVVTFGNGMVQREPIVTCDDQERRLVYTAVDSPLGATHYNGAVLVSRGAGDGARVEWRIDVLPNSLAERLDQAMGIGAAAMKRTLEHPDV
jgi:Polyketide cyclase / dehydrase and lipid transport